MGDGTPHQETEVAKSSNYMAGSLEFIIRKAEEKSRTDWAKEKPKLEAAQAARGFEYVPADDNEYLNVLNDTRHQLVSA